MNLHPAQRHIIESPKHKKAYIGGRVCGKTRLVAAEALESAADWTNTDVFAPQHKMIMEIRDRVVEEADKMDVSYSIKNKHVVEFELGGKIRFWSVQADGWKKKVRSSPSVIIDEAQEIKDKQLEELIERRNVVVAGQNHERIHRIVPYENNSWEYAICPTTFNPELNGAMLEEQWMSTPNVMFSADFLIRLLDLSNKHTLALPERAYPYWKARCLDCGYSKTVDVRNGIDASVKEYIIGEALNNPCR